jgi:hypothetical protein
MNSMRALTMCSCLGSTAVDPNPRLAGIQPGYADTSGGGHISRDLARA